MADIKVSQLNDGAVDANSYLLESNTGVSYKVKASDIGTFVNTSQADYSLNTTAKTIVGAINELAPTILTGTLTTGSTTLTLSDVSISSSSTLEVFTDIFGAWLEDMVVSTGSVVLTFEAQSSDMSVKVRVS